MHENQGMVHIFAATIMFTLRFNMAAQNVGQDFMLFLTTKGTWLFEDVSGLMFVSWCLCCAFP